MSYMSSLKNCAQTLDARLDDLFSVPVIADSSPLVKFLMSDINRQFVNSQTIVRGAKKRTVLAHYFQELLETDTSTSTTLSCTATTERGIAQKEYVLDEDIVYAEELINVADLNCTFTEFEEYFAQTLARLMRGVEKKVATNIATAAATLTGTWSDDVESAYTVSSNKLQVDLYDSSNKVNEDKIFDIDAALMMSGFTSPFIVGGNEIFKYYKLTEAGCCAQSGVDLGELYSKYGKVVAYDRRVQSALGGQDMAVAIQPGALQILYWTQYDWKAGVPLVAESATTLHIQVQSPTYGFPMDVTVKEDCFNYHIRVNALVDVKGLPSTIYQTNDNFTGLTWVNKIQKV